MTVMETGLKWVSSISSLNSEIIYKNLRISKFIENIAGTLI
jgi:hypothetical protein